MCGETRLSNDKSEWRPWNRGYALSSRRKGLIISYHQKRKHKKRTKPSPAWRFRLLFVFFVFLFGPCCLFRGCFPSFLSLLLRFSLLPLSSVFWRWAKCKTHGPPVPFSPFTPSFSPYFFLFWRLAETTYKIGARSLLFSFFFSLSR